MQKLNLMGSVIPSGAIMASCWTCPSCEVATRPIDGDQGVPQGPIDFTPALRFTPPSNDDSPESLFCLRRRDGNTGERFTRRLNGRQLLIYTDGACINNGQIHAIGGCAFVFKGGVSPADIQRGTVSFRLENRGPSGVISIHTSNRAELRAVIAALQFRVWNGEGYNQLVIATDSEYVVSGATEWIEGWVKRGWVTNKGTAVKNRDLWDLLFREMEKFRYALRSLRVLFWRIPREWNKVADQAAKQAAATTEARDSFMRFCGAAV